MSGAIKINGTSSGSTTITAPASGGDESIELSTALAAKAALAGATYTGTHDFTGATVTGIASGLALITTQSFTTASAVNVNNCFTSTYDHYRLVISAVTSGDAYWTIRMRGSGADLSTSVYASQECTISSTTVSASRITGQSAAYIGYSATGRGVYACDLYSPAIAEAKYGVSHGSRLSGGNVVMDNLTFQVNQATAYDGFSLTPSTGTLTGSLAVYGYKK